MASGHTDRLSATDASFLHEERGGAHMHVGAVAILDGEPPSREEFVNHLDSRLRLVPRYRQKLAFPRFEMGRPFWVDDPRFNLDFHVRTTALPDPGSLDELRELAGWVFSQRLDRTKPLWEVWLVEGLEGGRFALLWKTHHALVDGVASVDIATVLFDTNPGSGDLDRRRPAGVRSDWSPGPEPTQAQLVGEGVKGLLHAPERLAGAAARVVTDPGGAANVVREAAGGVGEVARAVLSPAPDVPLNTEIGPHRRLEWADTQLDDFKTIKNALGGTVNDAFLAVVTGALSTWLRARGVATEQLELRALVPISIRGEGDQGTLGNRVLPVRGPLPVGVEDPVERLHAITAAMAGVKESRQALGAEVISGLEDFAPPTILAQASRLNFSTRLFNLIVTNVPGPQLPLYLLGREMSQIVPVAYLPSNHALAIAAMSYNGRLDVGLLGDFDAMPDLTELTAEFSVAVDELLDAAGTPARR